VDAIISEKWIINNSARCLVYCVVSGYGDEKPEVLGSDSPILGIVGWWESGGDGESGGGTNGGTGWDAAARW